MSSSSRSSRSGHSSRKGRQSSVQQLIESLRTHRVNTLTELCRIERVAASCEDEEESRAFQEPMTSAWDYYVNSNQFLTELRGLTRNYPISGEMVEAAHQLVRNDPNSNRSWNLAWLCLVKIRDDGLIPTYAQSDSWRREMWGGRDPTQEEADQLAQCFEWEWTQAVENMLRHWAVSPTWY
ncbi:hypothetical protein F5B20DRAFT_551302 [Whalleya microplaca]|nr:hypothetical protein F5B20DRAFT_551302 [Whalleya microplaca]